VKGTVERNVTDSNSGVEINPGGSLFESNRELLRGAV